MHYVVTPETLPNTRGALIDRGSNGGLAGGDVRVISNSSRTLNVQVVDNHQFIKIKNCNCENCNKKPAWACHRCYETVCIYCRR